MARYHSPIHSPVFPSQLSNYSSLSGALSLSSSKFTSPRRRRVPQSVYKSSSEPMHAPITFDYIGQNGQGVSLSDFSALSQNALGQMVAGAHDQVLAKTGVNKINLRIMWTGYEHLNCAYSMPASPAMSRGQLGANIAMQFWSFVEQANKSTTSQPEWKIGVKNIRFDQIYLITLYHIGDDIWQADIAVDI